MDVRVLEQKYLKLTIQSAKLATFWPWPKNKRKQIIVRVMSVGFFFTAITPQLARMVCFFSINVLMEQIAYVLATVLTVVKLFNYVLNADKDGTRKNHCNISDTSCSLKENEFEQNFISFYVVAVFNVKHNLEILFGRLLEVSRNIYKQYRKMIGGIRSDWLLERPQKEMDIILKYANRGYLFAKIYLISASMCVALFLQMPITPRILDVVLPKNESRPLGYLYPAYYAVDEHKYHVYIVAHMYIGISMLTYIYFGCDTSFMFSVQHACGLLAVAGYRYKTAIGESVKEKGKISKDELYKRVCDCIQGHQHAIQYLKIVQEAHDTYLFISVGIIMVGFSVSLVKVSHMDMCTELVKDYMFVVIQLVHVLYLTVQGQFVINSLDKITERIYASLWYNSDTRTQLLFVLSLRNCLSPTLLTAGGLITLNLQSFSDIIKASVSYFTVLKTA